MYNAILALALTLSIANGVQSPALLPTRPLTVTLHPAIAALSNRNGIEMKFDLINPNPTPAKYEFASALAECLRFKVVDEHGSAVEPRESPNSYREYLPRIYTLPANGAHTVTVDLQSFVPITRPGSYRVSMSIKVNYVGRDNAELKSAPALLTVTP